MRLARAAWMQTGVVWNLGGHGDPDQAEACRLHEKFDSDANWPEGKNSLVSGYHFPYHGGRQNYFSLAYLASAFQQHL